MTEQKKPQQQQGSGSSGALDTAMVGAAVVLALAGVLAFAFLGEQPLLIRLGALLAGLAAAVLVAWFSPTGKRGLSYAREAWTELRRIVWPSRRETLMTTGIVGAFVVVLATFMFLADKIIEVGLYDFLLKLG